MRSKNKIDFARNLRIKQTDAESKLWHLLRNRRFQGFKFRRQYVIGRYVVDFCCVGKNLVIELDGGQHTEEAKETYDQKRTTDLIHRGYKVLRFWDNDILKKPELILEVIEGEVEK